MKVNNMKCIGAFSPSVSVQTGENIPGNVYTEDNLLAGKGIEIVDEPVEGGIDNHTLACWHFDGNSNNEVSSSPFLEYAGSSAEYGDIATKFNGYASKVVVKTIQPVSVKALTIDFWVKITTTFSPFFLTDYLPLDYKLKFVSPKLNLENKSGPQTLIEAKKEINVNEWHHIALVYTLSGVNYFIDGELQGTHEYSLSDITIVSNKDIMQMKPYGNIDELRISNIARPLNDDGKFPVPTKPYSVAVPTGKKQINFTGEIPDMSSLATKEELTTVTNQIGDQVSGIETKIPETATAENKLVTKTQMDDAIAGAAVGGVDLSNYVQKSGDTMAGPLTTSNDGIVFPEYASYSAQIYGSGNVSSRFLNIAATGGYVNVTGNSNTQLIRNGNTGKWFLDEGQKGVANGIASLDANAKVTSTQIPVATSSSLGGVKPDGTSITINETGTISTVNTVQSTTINNIVKLTQAEYDALVTKDQNTLYYIVG